MIVDVLIGGLVTWRVSRMLVYESGPLLIFDRLRACLAQKQKRNGGLFDLISCMNCTSIWIGSVASLFIAGGAVEFFMYLLSFSAISSLIERYMK